MNKRHDHHDLEARLDAWGQQHSTHATVAPESLLQAVAARRTHSARPSMRLWSAIGIGLAAAAAIAIALWWPHNTVQSVGPTPTPIARTTKPHPTGTREFTLASLSARNRDADGTLDLPDAPCGMTASIASARSGFGLH